MIRFLLSVSFFVIFIVVSYAQPLIEHSCHYAHAATNLIRREPSAEELLMMENSNKRSDTIDIINYTINIDVTDVVGKKIKANTKVSFIPKISEVQSITLDLLKLKVDSVFFKGQKINFNYDSAIIVSFFNEKLVQGTEYSLDIYYQGAPTRDPQWGGVYFADKYIYNLGIGLSTTPPNFGKVWFPCFDNFVERTTYDYFVSSVTPTRAHCVGHLVSEDSSAQMIKRHYRMDFPIPTYLSSFAVSDYVLDRSLTQSIINNNLPIDLIARPADLAKMKSVMVGVPDAVDAFEFWFGPYKFERVGFVATTVGAMEHPTNTAYPIGTVNGGTLTDNERLMAHEFGHQWWGNLTTLDDARDMWIKEGNAEYASHLFFEHVYGKERFQDVVKANLSNILFNAHLNDMEYLPLSPMPYAHTYGTHTYRKGAAMIHNLRAYLGDSNYRKVCHTIFDSLTGKSMNAFEFRDFVNRNSPVQVTDYFNDHIFNRGYLGFYIDSIIQSPSQINQYNIQIMQKSHHADHIGNEVPLKIFALDKNWNKVELKVSVSNESNWVKIELPLSFNPVVFLLNEDQTLNYASLQDHVITNAIGALPLAGSSMTPAITAITDTAYINIAHHLVGPSEGRKKSNVLKISDTHFWQVYGISDGSVKMNGRVDYSGNAAMNLDYNILRGGEDSVILVYRKDFNDEWRSYQPVTKIKVTPNDNRGIIRIDELIPGEYALAYGYNPPVSTTNLSQVNLELFPNPADNVVMIKLNDESILSQFQIVNESGQILINYPIVRANQNIEIDVSKLTASKYSLIGMDNTGRMILEKPFVIQR